MGQALSMAARHEITKKYAREYAGAANKERGPIQDESWWASGWSRANARRAKPRTSQPPCASTVGCSTGACSQRVCRCAGCRVGPDWDRR